MRRGGWIAMLLACACADSPAHDEATSDGTTTASDESSTSTGAMSTSDADDTSTGPTADSTSEGSESGESEDTESPPSCARGRTEIDRPDDHDEPQIHVVYAIPSDGEDRGYDFDGTLAASVAVWNDWLGERSEGRVLRLDTCEGELDVTFFQIPKTDAEIASWGPYVREQIEMALLAADRIADNKLYAVYYDGSSTYSCGGGAWPPLLVGRVAALYLRGEPPGFPACPQDFAEPGDAAGYLEHAMLHEIVHTLGVVGSCAPHSDAAGHTTDDPSDLMYSGPQPWYPTELDPGNDDWWEHDDPDCPDLADSALLQPMPDDPILPTGWR